MEHSAEFRRCLVELDVESIKKISRHVSPNMPQPRNDYEVLCALHLARTKTPTLPAKLIEYSKNWLSERTIGKVISTVGVTVGAPPYRRKQALAIRDAMSDSVKTSIKEGIDLDKEAVEVKKRMLIARDKEQGYGR